MLALYATAPPAVLASRTSGWALDPRIHDNASVSLIDRTRSDVGSIDRSSSPRSLRARARRRRRLQLLPTATRAALHANENPSNSLPSNGRVAFLVRGEAYRLGGRNLDTAQAGGCNEGGTESQNQATDSLLKLLVQPLEARGNQVDMFVTETSGVESPCLLVEPGLQAMYQGQRNRSVVFRTAVRMGSQADSMRLALDFLKESAHGRVESVYDLVLLVRHDMVWTEAIHKWPPPADFSRFSFTGACEKRAGGAEKCVSDTLLVIPGSLFPAFDSVAGAEGSKCFEASFRHGSGHECSGAITRATGQAPSLVTDYVPRASVRRANPLFWLIGTPPDAMDVRKMDKHVAAGAPPAVPASGWTLHANACPAGHRSASEGECLAAVLEAAQALGRPIHRKWLRVVDDGPDFTVPSGCSYSSVSKRALFNRNPDGRSGSEYELLCLDEGQQTSHTGDVGLRTAVIPIADYIGFDFDLVAETDLDQDGVAPELPGVYRTLHVFRAKTDVAQVALIHVGKCAGWTVRNTLRNYNITVWEYHMRQPEFSDLEKLKTAITTRDPVDRAVSAFNWRHPSNPQIHNNPFGDSADPEESKLYRCFDSVHAFAEALDSQNTTTCAELARTMLTGPKSKRGLWSLIGDDTRWYLERVMSQLRQGEIDFTLTRVANLDADINYAVQWITDTPETQSVEIASVHDDDYPKKYDTDLSTAGRRLLRAALQPEYDLLEELDKLAIYKPYGK
jgi:hypothetical protein